MDQDFHHGRDANITPAKNVYDTVDSESPVLPDKLTKGYDIRLRWQQHSELVSSEHIGR